MAFLLRNRLLTLVKLGCNATFYPSSSAIQEHYRCLNLTNGKFGSSIDKFKDMQNKLTKKSQKLNKYIALARGAVNAGGGNSDPQTNKDLARVLEQCDKAGISRSTISKSVTEKALENDFTFLITTPGGLAVLVGCRANKLTHARNLLVSCLKKSLFPGSLIDMKTIGRFFERKGVINVSQPFEDGRMLSEEESMDLAIDVNAEEVKNTDDGLEFHCEVSDLKTMLSSFEDKDIPVAYYGVDYIASEMFDIDQDDAQYFEILNNCLQRKDRIDRKGYEFYIAATNFR